MSHYIVRIALSDPKDLRRVQKVTGSNHYALIEKVQNRRERLVSAIEQRLLKAAKNG